MTQVISKLDAAKSQLDTAIDLWFSDRDGLSVLTLAFASFRVLMNIYPHQVVDGFDAAIDNLIQQNIGWRKFSATANFLKHADKDPDGVLQGFHPDLGMPVIGWATLLYKRLNNGSLSLRMMAFDSWLETTAADELGIEELDQNAERAARNTRMREAIRTWPREQRMRQARSYYEFFLENYDRLKGEVEQAAAAGQTIQDVLDWNFAANERERR